MEPELKASSKPSRARKSSGSVRKKAPALNVRHMLYASGFSALLTFALSNEYPDLSVVSKLCSLVPSMTLTSGEITSPLTP